MLEIRRRMVVIRSLEWWYVRKIRLYEHDSWKRTGTLERRFQSVMRIVDRDYMLVIQPILVEHADLREVAFKDAPVDASRAQCIEHRAMLEIADSRVVVLKIVLVRNPPYERREPVREGWARVRSEPALARHKFVRDLVMHWKLGLTVNGHGELGRIRLGIKVTGEPLHVSRTHSLRRAGPDLKLDRIKIMPRRHRDLSPDIDIASPN